MTYEIGQTYKVRCVWGQIGRDPPRWWPVMGTMHDDKEIIGFPFSHYHIDWRFVPKRWLYNGPKFSYAAPLTHGGGLNEGGFGEPVIRRRKCRRDHGYPFKEAPWLRKLEAAHAACKATGRVCPHRGYDLSREPIAADGTITCPMHGLRWDAFTGELRPSAIAIKPTSFPAQGTAE